MPPKQPARTITSSPTEFRSSHGVAGTEDGRSGLSVDRGIEALLLAVEIDEVNHRTPFS